MGAWGQRVTQDDCVLWLRRIAAVVVGAAFAVALFLALTLQSLSATLAQPDFYPEQLEQADIYRFITTDLVDAFVEDTQRLEADNFGEDFQDNPVGVSGLTTQQIADAVRRALAPEDLERTAAPAVEQIAEYLAGERDEIAITVDLGGHIEAIVHEGTTLMRESSAYERLLDSEIEPRFGEWTDEALPPDQTESAWTSFLRGGDASAGDSLLRVFTRVVTPEWLADQVERSADELTGYLVGRTEGFELRVELDESQTAAAAEELEAILRDTDAYDLAHTAVIEPAVEEHVGAAAELPYGVALTREEALAALREAAPPAWVDQQAEVLARGVSAYLTGQSDGFTAEIDIASVKDDAAASLTDAALANLEASLRALPACSSAAEVAAARAAAARELPSCIPPGATASEIALAARPAIAAAIAEFMDEPVPDTMELTEADLRDAVREDGGDEALDALDDLRDLFRVGWTYTDADLRNDLSEEDRTTLDDVRSLLSDGYVIEFTADDRAGWEGSLEGAGDWADTVRRTRWVAFAVATLLLVAVGALGGMSWRGRVTWGAAALLVSAALIALVWGPVYQAASGAALDAARDEIATDPGAAFALTADVLSDKLLDVIVMVTDELAGGMARNGLLLAALAVVVLAVTISWDRIAEATARARR